jgi:hypothetical protein
MIDAVRLRGSIFDKSRTSAGLPTMGASELLQVTNDKSQKEE